MTAQPMNADAPLQPAPPGGPRPPARSAGWGRVTLVTLGVSLFIIPAAMAGALYAWMVSQPSLFEVGLWALIGGLCFPLIVVLAWVNSWAARHLLPPAGSGPSWTRRVAAWVILIAEVVIGPALVVGLAPIPAVVAHMAVLIVGVASLVLVLSSWQRNSLRSPAAALVGLMLAAGLSWLVALDLGLVTLPWGPQVIREVRRLEGHAIAVSRVALSPDGRRALSTSSGYAGEGNRLDNSVRVWDTETGAELRRLDNGQQAQGLAVSPDGRRAATSERDGIQIWDLDTGKEVKRLEAKGHAPWAVAFSPDGRRLLSGGTHDGTVRLWDLETGTELRALPAHSRFVTRVAFSADGKWGASGTYADRFTQGSEYGIPWELGPRPSFIQIWDLETGRQRHLLEGHVGSITALAFSPDGKRMASGSDAGDNARLWDVTTGQELHRRRTGDQVLAIHFTADGRHPLFLSMALNRVYYWDLDRDRQLGWSRAVGGFFSDYALDAAISADGRYALGGCNNGLLVLWDLPED